MIGFLTLTYFLVTKTLLCPGTLAEMTLGHLDLLRQNCRNYDLFNQLSIQSALQTVRSLCTDAQKKKFSDLFALADSGFYSLYFFCFFSSIVVYSLFNVASQLVLNSLAAPSPCNFDDSYIFSQKAAHAQLVLFSFRHSTLRVKLGIRYS